MGGLAFIGGILLIIVGLLWCSIQDNGVKETGFVILAIIASAIIVGALMYIWYLLITYPKELFTVLLYVVLSVLIIWSLSVVIRFFVKPEYINQKLRYNLKKLFKKYDNDEYILSDFNKKSLNMTAEEQILIDTFNKFIKIKMIDLTTEKPDSSDKSKSRILHEMYDIVSKDNTIRYLHAINSVLDKISKICYGQTYIYHSPKLLSSTNPETDRYVYDQSYRKIITDIIPDINQVKSDIRQFMIFNTSGDLENDENYEDTFADYISYRPHKDEILLSPVHPIKEDITEPYRITKQYGYTVEFAMKKDNVFMTLE